MCGLRTAMLDSLGLTYTVGFPANAVDLHKYRAVLIFTGDNASFGDSGFSPTQERRARGVPRQRRPRLGAGPEHGPRPRQRQLPLAARPRPALQRLPRARVRSGQRERRRDEWARPLRGHGARDQPDLGRRNLFTLVRHGHVQLPWDDEAVLPDRGRRGRLARPLVGSDPRAGAAGGTSSVASRWASGSRASPEARAAQLGDRTFDWLLDKVTVNLASSSDGPGSGRR